MYLGGRGIHKRTRELSDAIWDKLPYALLGLALMIAGPIVSCGLLLHRFSWEPPLRPEHKIIALLINIACIGGGILLLMPWARAKSAIDAHTAAMRRETEQRGEGWASN